MRRSLPLIKKTNTNCCGGNCGCGADCNCGSGCGGCKNMNPVLGWERAGTTTSTGAATQKGHSEGLLMVAGSGSCNCSTCKCGTSCSCACCNCN